LEHAGRGGIPVLLLHELGGSNQSWRKVIPSLALVRLEITAADLGGDLGARSGRVRRTISFGRPR